jgi:hypothetical protein
VSKRWLRDPTSLLVELRFDYGRAEKAPHQGCGKVCGVSGAKNVCSERSLSGLLRKGD